MVFLGDLHFPPTLRLTWLKMSDIILTGRKTKIKKNTNIIFSLQEEDRKPYGDLMSALLAFYVDMRLVHAR